MLWRVGHKNDPAGFVPRSLCRWLNRWDDPEQEFRTSYAAEEPGTALVEVFQAYAPSVIAQTTRGRLYPSRYLYPSPDLLPGREHLKALLGPSKWEWQALVAVEVEADGRILDITSPGDRRWLERELTDTLVALGIVQVTTHELTDEDRSKTQRIARAAFDRGIAGFRYPSNVGEVPCLALFEGRGKLIAVGGAPRPLDPDMVEAHELLRAEIQLIHIESDDNTDELARRSEAR
jgi:hypothetical protein